MGTTKEGPSGEVLSEQPYSGRCFSRSKNLVLILVSLTQLERRFEHRPHLGNIMKLVAKSAQRAGFAAGRGAQPAAQCPFGKAPITGAPEAGSLALDCCVKGFKGWCSVQGHLLAENTCFKRKAILHDHQNSGKTWTPWRHILGDRLAVKKENIFLHLFAPQF